MSKRQYVEVQGMTPSGTGLQPRLEIRDIINRPNYLSLYMRALTRFQSTPKDNVVSWFQIGGIHGRPFGEWDGVPRQASSYDGYCTHASILFPTWHRSWLALFEQTLYENAKALVDEMPSGTFRDDLAAVLPEFRMPYWDWAQVLPEGAPIVPAIFINKEWEITGPEGMETIKNPLHSHYFGKVPTVEFPFSPYAIWLNTVRHPFTYGYPDTIDPNEPGQPDKLQEAFNDNMQKPGGSTAKDFNIRDRIYHLLTNHNYSEFKYFSNTSLQNPNAGPEDIGFDSLEGVHNTVHNLVGGNGHMADPDYACFDPIFALHHTFIDRIFAFWQVLFPESPMERVFNAMNDRPEGPATDLAPFHRNQESLWDSELTGASAWHLTQFGSVYPELTEPNPAAWRPAVEEAVKVLYGSTAPQTRLLHRHKELIGSDGVATEYFATMRVEKHALNSSFNVHVYIGNIANKSEKDKHLVGTFGIFTSRSDSSCERCAHNKAGGLLVTAAIPLTNALLDKILESELKSLDRETVGPYIQKELKWEIASLDGTPLGDVPSLQVGIMSADIEVGELRKADPRMPHRPVPAKLPKYHKWKQIIAPTKGHF